VITRRRAGRDERDDLVTANEKIIADVTAKSRPRRRTPC
jgi:hypothetical protein